MIGLDPLNPCFAKGFCGLLYVLPGGAVHQGGAAAHQLGNERLLVPKSADLDHLQGQVRSVKALDKPTGLFQAQGLDDIVLHQGGRRRRQGHGRHALARAQELLTHLA